MAKFVLVFHGGWTEADEAAQSDVMNAWMKWFGELGPSLVDPGAPFGSAAIVASDRNVTEGGGPDAATGYTVIDAPSLDAAVEHAKGCPGLDHGGSVSVHEAIPMG